MSKFMFVLMGNDFPDAVFDDEALGEQVVEKLNNAPENIQKYGSRRIYWRLYKFEVNKRGQKFG